MLNKPPDDTPLERHRDWLQGVAISSDNGLIVSNSADGNLQIWPMPADVGEMISSEPHQEREPHAVGPWVQTKTPYDELRPSLEVASDVLMVAGKRVHVPPNSGSHLLDLSADADFTIRFA